MFPYVIDATRLFSPMDRISALNLSEALVERIHKEYDLSFENAYDCVFVPYRDTDQEKIQGAHRSRQIFLLDIENLKKSTVIVARLDGLSKDSGVTFEMGYAKAKGIGSECLFTDFIWQGNTQGVQWTLDPVIQLADITAFSHYKPPTTVPYREAQMQQEKNAIEDFTKQIKTLVQIDDPLRIQKSHTNRSIYVDCMGGKYDWNRHFYCRLPKDDAIHPALRWSETQTWEQLLQSAQTDLRHAMDAKTAVFIGDCTELDMGTSFLMGLCYGMGKQIVFQYTADSYFCGDGGQQMRINLMLEQCAHVVTTSTEETLDVIAEARRSA